MAEPEISATPPVTGEDPPVEEVNVDLVELAKKSGLTWIYEQIGGDQVVLDYLEDHPEGLDSILKVFGKTKAEIDTREELQELNIMYRIGLLIWAQLQSGSEDEEDEEKTTEAPAELTLREQLKGKGKSLTFGDYKSYWEANPGAEAPLLPDSTHAIVKNPHFDWVEISFALATKEEDVLKKWPELFPYPAGSRIVMDKDPAEVQKFADSADGKLVLESLGLKMTVVPLGTTDKPAEDEIQLVSLQDTDPLNEDTVKAVAAMWDDGISTQFAGAPKTVAAVQALKEKPETQPLPQVLLESAKAFFTAEKESIDLLDFDKALITKPDDAHFDESYTFITNVMHVGEHPNNAKLKKEDVAQFLTIPTKDGDNAELLAFDTAGKIIGFAD